MSSIPSSTQVLVVGGGPAGSYAATVLAREGFSVALLESARFPRYHIGESMLPSARMFLRFIDADDIINNYGFARKPGAAFKFSSSKCEGYTDFTRKNKDDYTWNVLRSEFDDILFKHAAKSGASVFDGTKVKEIHFSEEFATRPVAASWQDDQGNEGKIQFDYLIDASGRNGIMSTKYLKNRRYNKSLHNIACWGYWENTGMYRPGTERENAVWVEALHDESGWAWFIPLHDGSVSVGVVQDQEVNNRKKKFVAESAEGQINTLQKHYLRELERAPGVQKFIENAKLRGINTPEGVKSASDFSYSASSYAGDHFRLVGDAAAFIDPYFSSGVHLALVGGLSAAITVSASIRGSVTEDVAVRWHDTKIATSYTSFLMVVLSAYHQIRNQNKPVLSDIDEDNFDRAFDFLRPVIQGRADVDKAVTEDEINKTVEFCSGIFGPTDEAIHKDVAARLDPSISAPGEILSIEIINALTDPDDKEGRLVAHKLNARKVVGPILGFGSQVMHGFRAVLERGCLQLQPVQG
ncbi:halogenase [Gelatoporia subvermispora B]|uniref:Halogenase n=1 Tax=Ceriporiopsis subvermispora (strain B) TaxID=914234 RepID=M2RBA2_CERS8|nr:halogenase [Gelatoporia subvermispora B]